MYVPALNRGAGEGGLTAAKGLLAALANLEPHPTSALGAFSSAAQTSGCMFVTAAMEVAMDGTLPASEGKIFFCDLSERKSRRVHWAMCCADDPFPAGSVDCVCAGCVLLMTKRRAARSLSLVPTMGDCRLPACASAGVDYQTGTRACAASASAVDPGWRRLSSPYPVA